MSEITEAMVERAHEAYSTFGQVGHLRAQRLSDAHMKAILTAALAARPAPEAGSVVERLRAELDEQRTMGEPISSHVVSEAADLIESQAAQIASLSAKVAEVELANADLELIADENADNVRLIDKIAKLIGIPHDQELTIQDVHVWKHAAEARASELQREVERLRKAIDDALGRHQVTHIHAGLRAALQQEGESDA